MPHNNQINYSVKVRLDPDDQSIDQAVVWNNTSKKFELGTGTGITIINEDENNVLIADGSTDTIVGQDHFRYVGGGSSGANIGKVAIGDSDSPNPYSFLDIGNNVSAATQNNFPQAQYYSTATGANNIGLKIGLQRIPINQSSTIYTLQGALGMASKEEGDDNDIYIGNFNSLNYTATFEQYAVFGHNMLFALGEQERGGVAFTEVPDTVRVVASQQNSTFTVGDTVTATTDPGGRKQVATITNYSDNKSESNTVLELRLGATYGNGYLNPVTGDTNNIPYGDNSKFISFQRRKTTAEPVSSPSFIECGKIVVNGVAGPPGGETNPGIIYATTSDKRLKENIKPLSVGLNELLKIQPSEYNWKGSTGLDQGFIAQDLYTIWPKAVHKPHNETDMSDPWAVDYGKLTPLLVKAIQDQQKIIEKLKEKVINLENKIK